MFELTFLGTAASTPSPERGLPALLVTAPRSRFLVDCGEGTQRQLLRAGAGFRRLRHVLLTHAHLDHVLGLGGLIATLGLLQTDSELTICGSAETVDFARRYLASLWGEGRAPVLRMSEAMQHKHNLHRDSFVEIAGIKQPGPAPRFLGTPTRVQSPPARVGEHTDAILRDWGFTASEIAALHSAGAVAAAT